MLNNKAEIIHGDP